jgi:hypothetical protein
MGGRDVGWLISLIYTLNGKAVVLTLGYREKYRCYDAKQL